MGSKEIRNIIGMVLLVVLAIRHLNFNNDSFKANALRITGIACLAVGALNLILQSLHVRGINDFFPFAMVGDLLFIIGLGMSGFYFIQDMRRRKKQ